MPSDAAWLQTLPYAIRRRFASLQKYVLAVLDEVGLRTKVTKSHVQHIQIQIFVRSLDEFLQDGNEAARAAVDSLNALGIDGFRVGSELFAGRNEAVTRGERLSAQLRATAASAGF